MKKIISGILSIIILSSSLLLPNTAFATEEENNNELSKKQQIVQRLYDKYGDDLFPDAADSGSWGFDDSEETLEFGSLIPDIDDSVASPLWGITQDTTVKEKNHKYGTHGYIIEQASAESDLKIPSTYINLVYEIAKRCDSEYGSGKTNFCSALHGNGNYIANIAYLWKFARLVGANKSQVSKETDTNIKAYIDEMAWDAYHEVPLYEFDSYKDTADKLYELAETAPKVVKKYYSISSIASKSSQTWGGRCKYIIFGMIAHCIGDVYAHKVMLKPAAATCLNDENATYDSSTMLDKAFFIDDYFDVEGLKKDISNKKVALFQLKKYTNNVDKAKEAHHNYADNPKFYPKRIKEAIFALYIFIDYYKDVSSIYAIIDQVYSCLYPYYSFTLYRFDAYYDDLDL